MVGIYIDIFSGSGQYHNLDKERKTNKHKTHTKAPLHKIIYQIVSNDE